MSDPTRLFDGAGSADEKRLIASARAELAPAGAIPRTLTVLGAASGVLAPAASHAAGLGAGVAGGTAGKTGTALSLVKWLGAGVAGGLMTVAATKVITRDTPPATPIAVSTAVPPTEP